MKRLVSLLAAVCLLAAPFAVSAAEDEVKFSELYREERFLQTENAGKLSVMYGVSALGTSKGDVCAVSYDRDGDYISYPVTLSFNEKGEKTAYIYVITLPGSNPAGFDFQVSGETTLKLENEGITTFQGTDGQDYKALTIKATLSPDFINGDEAESSFTITDAKSEQREVRITAEVFTPGDEEAGYGPDLRIQVPLAVKAVEDETVDEMNSTEPKTIMINLPDEGQRSLGYSVLEQFNRMPAGSKLILNFKNGYQAELSPGDVVPAADQVFVNFEIDVIKSKDFNTVSFPYLSGVQNPFTVTYTWTLTPVSGTVSGTASVLLK
ncbi:MAG TPA: hypothetical protein IAB57_03815 [Candidatus Fimivivens faecavium]|nr:hypothetical protein [Candidatus Fimivivens faecavium]